MGAVLPDTPEVRAATASEKLHGALDLIEGDFLAWKKLERKLLHNSKPAHESIIDISSATSMNVFEESFTGAHNIDATEIIQKAGSYPYVLQKEHHLETTFATFFANQTNAVVSHEEVVVFNGIFASLRTIARTLSGQYVLMPEFANHAQKMSVTAMGKTVVEVPMFAPGWTLDLSALKDTLAELTGDVACMYIYHAMPADLTEEYLDELAEVLSQHEVVPVFDLDVIGTQHTNQHSPLLPFALSKLREQSIFLINMSKEFGAPGIRIGFGVMPPALAEHIKKFQQISLEMIPPTNRYLAERILEHYDFDHATRLFTTRMQDLVSGLQTLQTEATLPNVGVNLFMHVPRSFEASTRVLPDHLFTYYVLTRTGVVLRPASIYGHRLNHFVRFVVGQTSEQIAEMITRLETAGIRGNMPLPENLEEEYQQSIAHL